MCNGVQKAENLKILAAEIRRLLAARRQRHAAGAAAKGGWGLVLRRLVGA